MLLKLIDCVSGKPVYINPKQVVVVFQVMEGELAGKTAISLTNGNLVVEDNYGEVVNLVQEAMN